MRHWLRILVLGSAMAAWPAAAEDPTGGGSAGEIVVEGKRIEKKEIDAFVRALTDTPAYGQISRFEWEVCPAAGGLLPQQNSAIVSRIRTVAAAAGAPVGKTGCKPNMLVLVTRDSQQYVKSLRNKYPAMFKDEIDQPAHVQNNGAAVAWHVEGRLTQDNLPADIADAGTTKYYISSTMSSSRLTPPTRPHFLAGVLVLDVDSLGGLTTTQVADYATMRLLARTDTARLDRTAAPTILSVIDAAPDSQVPVTLTNWDFSYLKALYGSLENRYASSQRGQMQRMMRKDLQGDRARR